MKRALITTGFLLKMVLIEKFSEFLSTYAEIHSFCIGIYCGLTEWKGLDSDALNNPDVKAEIAYAKGGYILGVLLRWAIILTVGYAFFGTLK